MNTEAIQRAISVINWIMALQNKDIDEKLETMNETLLNIFNNFIPNKISKFYNKKQVSMNLLDYIILEEKIETY